MKKLHTEGNPIAEVAYGVVDTIHEAVLKVITEITDHGIHERFKTHDTALRVVLDDGTLHPGMFSLVSGTE